MQNHLPRKNYAKEQGIVNWDSDSGLSTHSVAYTKKGSEVR